MKARSSTFFNAENASPEGFDAAKYDVKTVFIDDIYTDAEKAAEIGTATPAFRLQNEKKL